MIESFRLPFSFDVGVVQAELLGYADPKWLPHFNTGYYSGNWSGIALRAPGGNSETLYPVSDKEYSDTGLMSAFPSVSKIIEQFQCNVLTVRFLRLEKGGVIKEHYDNALSFEDGEVRFHIPIQTNSAVEFTSNGKSLAMNEGECWYINAALPHSAANNGEADRIHLVIDCVVNDWMRSFFPNVETLPDNGMSAIRTPKDLQNMINALRNIGSPVALQMAEELSRKDLNRSDG
jgi:mannose-6-phosphate isomerase-like protein (cupin superfamily)